MVMPVWDHSSFKWPTPPYVMWFLIVVNLIVFVEQVRGGPEQMGQVGAIAGVIPAALNGRSVGGLWPPLTLITYQFLHINFWHVVGNMIVLFVFGRDVEKVLGHWRFLAFYLLCGIGSGLVFVLNSLDSDKTLIGASGAVAGILSVYLLFRPCARVTLLGLIPFRIRAYGIISVWAIWQVIETAKGVQDGVGYWAHIGGLSTGAILFIVIRSTGVKLFDLEPVVTARKFEPPGVMRFVLDIGEAVMALVVVTVTALALFTAQWRTCTSNPGIDWDTQIGSCTALIQSSQETARNRAVAYNNRGNAYYRKGDFETALADYNAAIQLEPNYAFAYHNRGLAWEAKGELDRAIADYTEAIRLDPKSALAYNNRCWARATANRELQHALGDCNEAMRLMPDDTNTMDSRGFVYLRLDRLDDAIADYDAALKINPKNAGSLYGRGLAKLRKGDIVGGDADIAAAKAIQADIIDEFARYGVTAIAAGPSQVIAPAADCATAEAHWKDAETMGILAGYEDHLTRFPNCPFADLARMKVETLNK